ACRCRRVARPHRDSDFGEGLFGFGETFLQLSQRALEIALNVVVQRLEWRDVEYVNGVRERSRAAVDDEIVQLPEKRGQRLSGTRWCQNQGVSAARNRRPDLLLRSARLAEGLVKPLPDERMEWFEYGRRARSLRH